MASRNRPDGAGVRNAPRLALWREAKGLKRQNQVLHEALKAAGVASRLVVTPWEEHFLIVAALSHPERLASTAILDFIRTIECR